MKQQLPYTPGPIGVFDSGYGGLTILNKIREILPDRKSTRLNSSHYQQSRMPSSA